MSTTAEKPRCAERLKQGLKHFEDNPEKNCFVK
jgi:hypothetical protein